MRLITGGHFFIHSAEAIFLGVMGEELHRIFAGTANRMISFDEYAAQDGLSLGALVSKQEVTATELLDAAIARAARVNPAINAIIYEFHDLARQMARERGNGTGAFEGVPFLLKDILGDITGVPSRAGSRYLPIIPATVDSELVARFKRAGFVPFGKPMCPSSDCRP